MSNISIKDIARLSGVSVATVSRVINNNGRFSKETKEKVEKIIEEYGYTQNMAAKSLRMSKSKTIGLIVPNIDNEWFSRLALSIENYFFNHHYSVFICNTSQDEQKEIEYFKSLDGKLVDGIICISGIEKIPEHIIQRDIPIVCIDRKPIYDHHAYYVESDHFKGGYLATQHLIEQGCRNIAILSRNKTLSVNNSRYQGYLKALKDYHIHDNPDLHLFIEPTSHNIEGSKALTTKLIESNIPFDGIFATNDWRAYGAIEALKEHHLSVPDDVKVIGFDDASICKVVNPTISTIKQDIDSLSFHASKCLLDLIEEKEVEPFTSIDVKLIVRESTKKYA